MFKGILRKLDEALNPPRTRRNYCSNCGKRKPSTIHPHSRERERVENGELEVCTCDAEEREDESYINWNNLSISEENDGKNST